MFRLVDTHAHLEELTDLEPALQSARAAGVVAIVAVGSDAASNKAVLDIARAYPGFIYPALGLHPWNLKKATLDSDLASIEENIGEAVAVGEVGLDYHKKVRELADKGFQQHAFREVIRIAARHNKPVLIHSRYGWRDAFDLVTEQPVKAVFHWYTGTSSVLERIVAGGYYLSATPAVTYHEEHRRAVKAIPLNRLLLETDTPVMYGRGSPTEFEARPADVARVLEVGASLRGLPAASMAEATTANAFSLFSIAQ